LIEQTGYDDDTKQIMVNKVMDGLTKGEFDSMLKDAQMNAIDPITSGRNYNQTDIANHINKLS
jgi:hypothetical protein